MSDTTITVTVDQTTGMKADCSFSAQPATWAIAWVQPGGEINTPGTQNTVRLELSRASSYKFVGIRMASDPAGLSTAEIHSDGQIPDTPFSIEIDAAQKTLTLHEVPSTWAGWKAWYYSIGITDGGSAVCWCDPKIYNKGDS